MIRKGWPLLHWHVFFPICKKAEQWLVRERSNGSENLHLICIQWVFFFYYFLIFISSVLQPAVQLISSLCVLSDETECELLSNFCVICCFGIKGRYFREETLSAWTPDSLLPIEQCSHPSQFVQHKAVRNSFTEVQMDTSAAFPSSTKWCLLSQREIWLKIRILVFTEVKVRQDLPSVNLCWLGLEKTKTVTPWMSWSAPWSLLAPRSGCQTCRSLLFFASFHHRESQMIPVLNLHPSIHHVFFFPYSGIINSAGAHRAQGIFSGWATFPTPDF